MMLLSWGVRFINVGIWNNSAENKNKHFFTSLKFASSVFRVWMSSLTTKPLLSTERGSDSRSDLDQKAFVVSRRSAVAASCGENLRSFFPSPIYLPRWLEPPDWRNWRFVAENSFRRFSATKVLTSRLRDGFRRCRWSRTSALREIWKFVRLKE